MSENIRLYNKYSENGEENDFLVVVWARSRKTIENRSWAVKNSKGGAN